MPYYTQENGQVNVGNKIIIFQIKIHVGQNPRNWHKTMDQELWAYRTSPREATNSIPFRLAFGHDAVFP